MTMLMTRSTAKVRWTGDEKARVIAAGREIRRGDPTRGDLSTLRKAMRDALPPGRHRPLRTLPRFQYQWFVDGIEAESGPEPPPEPGPIPGPAPIPEPAGVGLDTLVGLNRDVLGAVRTAMADLRLASEAMLAIARESAATRRILARVVEALDPGLASGPTPEPEPSPGPPPEPEPAPVARPRLPRIAVVSPGRSQVSRIKAELRGRAEVRVFETGDDALRKQFGACDHVICTHMVQHRTTAAAEALVGKARVHFLGKSGADAIIARATEIARKHRDQTTSTGSDGTI